MLVRFAGLHVHLEILLSILVGCSLVAIAAVVGYCMKRRRDTRRAHEMVGASVVEGEKAKLRQIMDRLNEQEAMQVAFLEECQAAQQQTAARGYCGNTYYHQGISRQASGHSWAEQRIINPMAMIEDQHTIQPYYPPQYAPHMGHPMVPCLVQGPIILVQPPHMSVEVGNAISPARSLRRGSSFSRSHSFTGSHRSLGNGRYHRDSSCSDD